MSVEISKKHNCVGRKTFIFKATQDVKQFCDGCVLYAEHLFVKSTCLLKICTCCSVDLSPLETFKLYTITDYDADNAAGKKAVACSICRQDPLQSYHLPTNESVSVQKYATGNLCRMEIKGGLCLKEASYVLKSGSGPRRCAEHGSLVSEYVRDDKAIRDRRGRAPGTLCQDPQCKERVKVYIYINFLPAFIRICPHSQKRGNGNAEGHLFLVLVSQMVRL
jgi:hypothetical protein